MSQPPTLPDADSPPSREPRPSGESGGHTVQDWEQPPRGRTLSNPMEGQAVDEGDVGHEPADEPSPPTIPLYLRGSAATVLAESVASTVLAEPAMSAKEARTRILTAQSAAIVDSITRGLAEALAVSLRPVVASTVVALLPMMLSLGSIPEDEWPDAARPRAKRPKHS